MEEEEGGGGGSRSRRHFRKLWSRKQRGDPFMHPLFSPRGEALHTTFSCYDDVLGTLHSLSPLGRWYLGMRRAPRQPPSASWEWSIIHGDRKCYQTDLWQLLHDYRRKKVPTGGRSKKKKERKKLRLESVIRSKMIVATYNPAGNKQMKGMCHLCCDVYVKHHDLVVASDKMTHLKRPILQTKSIYLLWCVVMCSSEKKLLLFFKI